MAILDSLNQMLSQAIGLITILNPIAGAAMMISLSGAEPSKEEVDVTARKTTLTVFIASIVTIALGELLFNFFGINTYSIQAIGGLVILKMSLKMIEGNSNLNHSADESKEAIVKTDISVIPLGIPIFFGPGTIATLILFKSESTSLLQITLLVVAVLFSCAIVYLSLKNAKVMSKRLGITGMKIATRLLGLVLGAIAVQFIVTGVYALWKQLH